MAPDTALGMTEIVYKNDVDFFFYGFEDGVGSDGGRFAYGNGLYFVGRNEMLLVVDNEGKIAVDNFECRARCLNDNIHGNMVLRSANLKNLNKKCGIGVGKVI